MKYQKYLTVLQMAIGVTPSNRGSLLPLKRKLWVASEGTVPDMESMKSGLKENKIQEVTPSSENPNGATSNVSQGKPSLRRIKGRLHRSKSLDSIDFCELT
ncbi:Tight junction protein ZO-1 [Apodemus speciosus]|uniref:Tight junction protein ZO-1 n=1 Tax=Apodemus speciosus TaxID=105296 RepID=A0ABQ0EYX9_APOSI